MSSESTSTLVLRSPVQGRPAIVWAAVLSQGARGLELAVTFLDSTVGGIALHLLDGTGLLDASKWGAWLWSHLWMEVADGVLHQECGWMREPIIGPRPRSEKDAAFELDQFPRDPQWVPEWMAVKAAAYHKEAEKWGRRARKKAEKAEAGGQLYVTGRIKDMMIVRGKNYFPNDVEKSLRRDLPILRGRRLVMFQNTEDLIYCFVEEVIEIGDSTGVPGLVRDSDDEVGSMLRSGIARSVAQKYGLYVADMRVVPAGSLPTTVSGKIVRTGLEDLISRLDVGENDE